MNTRFPNASGFLAASLLLGACSTGNVQLGGSASPATGAAGGSASHGASSQLEHCSESLGTVSLVENQSSGWYATLTGQYKLPPTANLLRLLIQQSNCFVVVERSAAGMRAISRERQLEDSGEMRSGSKFQKGQLVSSDYAMTPEINFSSDNARGMGGTLGGLLPGALGSVAGAVSARTKSSEASALLTLVDNRSGVQVSAAEGSASNTDWGGFSAMFGSRASGNLSGYTNTPQGKVIAGAFMDAYNQMVRSLREYRAQEVKGGLGKGGRLKVGD